MADTVKGFNLYPKQGLALLSKATEILYGGSAGSGKSHLMRVAAIHWALEIPGLQIYLFRRTSGEVNSNHMQGAGSFPALLADWVSEGQVKINWSKPITITFNNGKNGFKDGSKIFLNHCEHEKNKYNYDGVEMHLLLVDELTHFTDSIYRYLRSRVRLTAELEIPEKYKGLFPRILCSTNPGKVGHQWVKKAFVSARPEMEIEKMPKEEGGKLRQFIPARLSDNPSLNYEEYAANLSGLGSPELVRAMLDGDWDIVAGGMFTDVWRKSVHVIEPFDIPSSWYIDRSFDWGSSAPFSVCWWAESDGSPARLRNGDTRFFPRGTIFLIREWYGSTGKQNQGLNLLNTQIASGIKERELRWGLHTRCYPGPADNQIFSQHSSGTGRSMADEFSAAPNNIRWTESDKSSGSRVSGWAAIRNLMKNSLDQPMERPGLFVFNHCNDFITIVPELPRDDKNPEDVDKNSEAHIGDATRYRVFAKKKPKVGQANIGWTY